VSELPRRYGQAIEREKRMVTLQAKTPQEQKGMTEMEACQDVFNAFVGGSSQLFTFFFDYAVRQINQKQISYPEAIAMFKTAILETMGAMLKQLIAIAELCHYNMESYRANIERIRGYVESNDWIKAAEAVREYSFAVQLLMRDYARTHKPRTVYERVPEEDLPRKAKAELERQKRLKELMKRG
jgi:hypothetical protein